MFAQILNIVYVVAVVLFLFNLTIFIHELGHYLVGRWRGAKIERFAVWFGPALWSKTINGVEFRLGCVPLGGYVAFPQLAMEAIEGKSETPAEELPPLKPRDKIPILLAGSVANVLLGLVVACIVWVVGLPRDAESNDLKLAYVSPRSAEYAAGLMTGDEIVSINGKPVRNTDEIRQRVALSLTQGVTVGVKRSGELKSIQVTPETDHMFKIRTLHVEHEGTPVVTGIRLQSPAEKAGFQAGDEIREVDGIPVVSALHLIDLIGARAYKETDVLVSREGNPLHVSVTPKVEIESSTGLGAIGIGLGEKPKNDQIVIDHPGPWVQIMKSVFLMLDTVNALVHTKTTGVGVKHLSGPIGIGQVLYYATKTDFRLALGFLVLLNINLAIVNLLPIPVLDGGHIVFSLIESVRRKPLNHKFMEATQTVFMALLLTFMAYVTFNDLSRMVVKNKPGRGVDEPFRERPASAP